MKKRKWPWSVCVYVLLFVMCVCLIWPSFSPEMSAQQDNSEPQGSAEAVAAFNEDDSQMPEPQQEKGRLKRWFRAYRCDIGLGIFGSWVCSLLIDIGNTVRERERKGRELFIMFSRISAPWVQIQDTIKQYKKEDDEKKNVVQIYSFNALSEGDATPEYTQAHRSLIYSNLLRMEEACAVMEEYLERNDEVTNSNTIRSTVKELRKELMEFLSKVTVTEQSGSLTEAEKNEINTDFEEIGGEENEPTSCFLKKYCSIAEKYEKIHTLVYPVASKEEKENK